MDNNIIADNKSTLDFVTEEMLGVLLLTIVPYNNKTLNSELSMHSFKPFASHRLLRSLLSRVIHVRTCNMSVYLFLTALIASFLEDDSRRTQSL